MFDVDLAAIEHNVHQIRQIIGQETKLVAALKADAYGFGIEAVAAAVTAAGGDAFAVADVGDALRLRQSGATASILLYGGTLPDADVAAMLARYRIIATVCDSHAAERYSAVAERGIDLFVEVDVGMERLGVHPEHAVALVKLVQQMPRITLCGIYAHLHVGPCDGLDAYFQWQVERFEHVLSQLRDDAIVPPIVMLASSPLLAFSGGPTFDAVDVGDLIYGLRPAAPVRVAIDLRPAFQGVKSRLVHVKTVTRDEFRGRMPFAVDEPLRMGIMPLGRADGLAAFTSGEVLVRGTRCAILGRPSLEHCRVDLRHCTTARVGDEVVVIGVQGSDEITVAEVRRALELDYEVEVVTGIRESVPRRYRGR